MEKVDTVLVILSPESGDAIQTMKAGLLEIADIFVVNKADNPGAVNFVCDIQAMLQLREPTWWNTPVVATEAVRGIGVEDLWKQIQSHYRVLCEEGRLSQRRQLQRKKDFIRTLERKLTNRLLKLIEQNGQMSRYMERVEKGELDPHVAADEILNSGNLLADWLR
jgi:LAO/AO transport system kinase